ncbi:MAG TPA: acyltransferase [Rhodopseudomonas sp.]|uniref:acyltransferase family protein n=1 Tax=Rhodopseudomonas sp. TaxID=1078 RepID=UPI002ED79B08
MPASPPRFASIQVLRAIAANMVVVSHLAIVESKYGHGFALIPPCDGLGRAGVHMFFGISGFVMAVVVSGRPSWRGFLWARLTRIYPIYWFYTALVLLSALIVPVNSSFEQTPSLVRSLLLWPDATLPWLAVGWSLVHEMYFYLIVAVLLALRINLVAGLLIWATFTALPVPPRTPELALVFNAFSFEFIAGALLALAILKLPRLPTLPRWRLLETLGDASYSVYLSHVLVLSLIGRLFNLLPAHGWLAEAVFVVVCLVAANAWGVVSYRLLELPVINTVRSTATRRVALAR